jgi:Domain of unknown function (DUF932)
MAECSITKWWITQATTSYYASDRDLWVLVVDAERPIQVGTLPDGSPDLLTRGIAFVNSEVGKTTLRVMAFYFRASCCNRIFWGVENFQEIAIRHSRLAPSRFLEEARPALQSFTEGSAQTLLEGVEKAKAAKVAEDQEEALQWLAARNFSRERSMAILNRGEQEEGHPVRSAWDMAQAITADARDSSYQDHRFDQEKVAKDLLDAVVR